MKRILLALTLTGFMGVAHADDNAVAYRLFEQKRYAEAAELFTDPAWKGVAMYRSDQYWRAAEAFVRYARARVKGAMLDELRQMDHLGRAQRRKIKALQIARER